MMLIEIYEKDGSYYHIDSYGNEIIIYTDSSQLKEATYKRSIKDIIKLKEAGFTADDIVSLKEGGIL